jgi:hypothetical protein
MKRTQDADKEEWDIIDDGSCPSKTKTGRPKTAKPKSASRGSIGSQRCAYESDFTETDSAIRPGTATKALVQRKRKHSSPESSTGSQAPLIAIPRCQAVRLDRRYLRFLSFPG